MNFLNEYTILGELGKGGFAKVFKVRHNELGYLRAIRVLNEPITDEHSNTYQKFLRECRVLLRLGNGNHSNIVHIYQPRLLENHALVEMDFVDGKDLSRYLKDNDNYLPISEVLRMVNEISSALSYCHEGIYSFCIDPDEDLLEPDPYDGTKWQIDEKTKQRLIDKYKVIHNDIHSGNIMRREDGSFVLLDFGLAIEGGEIVKSSSRHDNGAPEYMPPEKWDNDSILSEQSDIYSFGIVMYEYLAGRVPFVCEGNSFNARKKFYDTIKNNTTLPSIADLRGTYYESKYSGKTYKKDYPDWLEEAILKCLEINPEKRFRNGRELHDFIVKHFAEDAENSLTIKDEKIESLKKENDKLKKRQNTARNNKAYLPLAILSCILVLGIGLCVVKYVNDTNGMKSVISKLKEQLTTSANSTSSNEDELRDQISTLQATIKTKDQKITDNTEQINALKQQLEAQTENGSKVSELETKLETADNKINSLNRELRLIMKERDVLREQLNN